MDTNIIETWHPKLKDKNWKIININKDLDKFNCFSFVIDIYDDWSGSSTKIWHNNSNRYSTLSNYIDFYSTYGYILCDDNNYDNSYNKIALYVNDEYVTHAAKQSGNMWRSKLGSNVIIEHELEWLSGNDSKNYGKVLAIMKKLKNS